MVGRKGSPQRDHKNDKGHDKCHQHFQPPEVISEVGSFSRFPVRDYVNIAELDVHGSEIKLKGI